MKRILIVLLALALMMASAAALAEAPEGYPEVVEGIDFGGRTIHIYDWWSSGERSANPSEEEAATYAYRDWIEKTYNCKVVQIQKCSWNTNIEELLNMYNAQLSDDLCFL